MQELKPGTWVLFLNDMRSSHIEDVVPALCGESPEELVEAMRKAKASESWSDGRWGKTFKKDSPLEWFNYPLSDSIESLLNREGFEFIYQWYPPQCLHTSELE